MPIRYRNRAYGIPSGRRRRPLMAVRRRRVPRRRLGAVPRGPRNGGFMVVRKLPIITLQSGAAGLAGNIFLSDPTSSCLSLATPVATTVANTFDVPFSMKFRLDQLINVAELTNLADKYRIISVYIKLHYNNGASPTGTTTGPTGSLPWIEYIQDRDDANLPTLNVMREKMGVKRKYFSNSRPVLGMACYPVPATEVFQNGITTAYTVPSRAPYVNSTYPGVEHYGIKGVFHKLWLPSTVNSLIDIDIGFKVALKDIQ